MLPWLGYFTPEGLKGDWTAVDNTVLRDAGASATARVKAALSLAFIERVQAGRPLELSCLAVGGIRIVHLPGEPFVEYQLWAQRAFPQWFVAVADL